MGERPLGDGSWPMGPVPSKNGRVLEHTRFQNIQSLFALTSQQEHEQVEEKDNEKEKEKEKVDGKDLDSTSRWYQRGPIPQQIPPGIEPQQHANNTPRQSYSDHSIDPKILRKIITMEEQAMALLEELESPPTSKVVHHQGPCLPTSAIRFSKYLVFLWQRKVGCVVSYEWRYGFILFQMAPGVWSPPVFLKHRYVSVGATCGWSCGASIYAISDDVEMIAFMKNGHIYKHENSVEGSCAGCGGASAIGSRLPNTWSMDCRYSTDSVKNTTTSKIIRKHVTRYHVDAASSYIFDLSCKVGLESIDRSIQSALYGARVDARDVLDGLCTQHESVLHDVYTYLGAKAKHQASMTRQTMPLFERERKSIYSSMNAFQRRSSSCLSGGGGRGGRFSRTSSVSSSFVSDTASSSLMTASHGVSPRSSLNFLDREETTDMATAGRNQSQPTSLFGDTSLLDLDLGDP